MSTRKKEPVLEYSRVPKRFYRRQEVAHAIGCSVRIVDERIADQTLRTRKMGRCVLIPAEDVDRLTESIMNS